jgi:hypothetical protein
LLKVSGLKAWVGRSWSSGSFSNGLDAINIIAETYLFEKGKSKVNESQSVVIETEMAKTPEIKTPEIRSPQNFFNTQFFRNDNLIISESLLKEKFKNEIKKEIEDFRVILLKNKSEAIYKTESSRNFWLDRLDSLPNLSKLALILSNINSSSAFIERYFSICGFVEDKRKMNISHDLFIKRCFLRANVKILNEINEE